MSIKVFSKKVNKSSKKAMIDFLSSHFRYDTMGSNNASTSYANKIKLHTLPLPEDIKNIAYDMIQMDEWQDRVGMMFSDFAHEHDHRWQVGCNGRSGGYVVLYQGYKEKDTFSKSRCPRCGIKTGYEPGKECQKCHNAKLLPYDGYKIGAYFGRSTDMNEDFETWDIYALKARVKLVQEFDELCDNLVNEFIDACRQNTIEDETVMVPKQIKVLKPK
jgi:hypothetical protein